MRKSTRIFLLMICSTMFGDLAVAQEDRFGNWLMYFGQHRIADKFSLHTEFQYRNHTLLPNNTEQLMIRGGLNYLASTRANNKALITAGYAFIPNYIYDSPRSGPEVEEHRIWQQLITTQGFQNGRMQLEHRYRIEQRFVEDDYLNRFRYRLMMIYSLKENDFKYHENSFFVAFYDEIFINGEKTFFDRNRLYAALGYKYNMKSNVQLGWLRQAVNDGGKYYLQLAWVHNTDLRN